MLRGTNYRLGDQDILYWDDLLQKFKHSGLNAKLYCKENNISYSQFKERVKIFHNLMYSNPEKYALLNKIVQECLADEKKRPLNYFAQIHGFSATILLVFKKHLHMLERIKKIKSGKTSLVNMNDEFRFIQPKAITSPPIQPTPEIITKKNDIELFICKGVKVIVSPEIAPEQLIRIIELLKDL